MTETRARGTRRSQSSPLACAAPSATSSRVVPSGRSSSSAVQSRGSVAPKAFGCGCADVLDRGAERDVAADPRREPEVERVGAGEGAVPDVRPGDAEGGVAQEVQRVGELQRRVRVDPHALAPMTRDRPTPSELRRKIGRPR